MILKYLKSPVTFLSVVIFAVLAQLNASELTYSQSETIELELLPGECWWGGLSVDGYRMPYGEATELRRDLYANNQGNQASPILISSKGRYVWSEMPYRYLIELYSH